MDTTLFQNVLFSALSLFIVVLTIIFIVFIVYSILILKRIHTIFIVIKKEAEKITNDIDYVRERLKSGGMIATSLMMYLASFFKKQQKKSK